MPSAGDRPTLSVILPVRNAEDTLASAIGSIIGQTFSAWELIIADDGSTDASSEIADRFAQTDRRIRVLSLPAAGIVVALNEAIAAARGEFIARMDADDISRSDRLARQVALLKEKPAVGVVSCLVNFGGNRSASRGYAEHVAWLNSIRTSEAIETSRFIESPLAHPSVVFKRELIQSHGGYHAGDFPEDYELWLRWMDAGIRFAKVEAELLTWNDSPGRLSRTGSRYATDAFYRIKCHYLRRWLARNVPPERPIWLWGAGRVTRKRFRSLEKEHGRFHGFVDIHPGKVGVMIQGRPVVAPEDVPPDAFLLVAVGTRGMRNEIKDFLESNGRQEGRDFLCAA